MKILVIGCVCLAAGLSVIQGPVRPASAARAYASLPVVAGKQAGKVQIGMPRANVLKLLGEPGSTRPESGGMLQRDVWEENNTKLDGQGGPFLYVYYLDNRVIQVTLTSTGYASGDGWFVGKNVGPDAYKNARVYKIEAPTDEGGPLHWYDSVGTGLAFELAPAGPTGQSMVLALAVHKPGLTVTLY